MADQPGHARDEAVSALPAAARVEPRAEVGRPREEVPRRRLLPARVWEWFTRNHALRAARAARAERPRRVRELQRRAQLARELADRTLDAVDPLPAGSGAPLAIELYREAAHWSLCALAHPTEHASAGERWNAFAPRLQRLVPDSDVLDDMKNLMLDMDFTRVAELGPAQQAQLASEARAFAGLLLDELNGPELQVGRLLLQRITRLLVLASIVMYVALDGRARIEQYRLGPNLLANKPWKASSEWAPCDTKTHRCGPLITDLFFHTQEDDTPWVEFNLGTPTRFSKVYVRNRNELGDRALPLAIEVSNDHKTYKQVALRTKSFRDWWTSFPPQTARWLRVRTLRKSYLHLEQVKAYR